MSDQINGQGRQEQRTRMFNPNEHMIQLRSKDASGTTFQYNGDSSGSASSSRMALLKPK